MTGPVQSALAADGDGRIRADLVVGLRSFCH